MSEALDNVSRDEMGRRVLQAKVKRVQLAVGCEQPHVTLVGDALTVMTVTRTPAASPQVRCSAPSKPRCNLNVEDGQ